MIEFDEKLLKKQRDVLNHPLLTHLDESVSPKEPQNMEGKTGCIILAGGEASRLGVNGPKGTFPVFENKTLFEILLSKTKNPVAIMTSPLNYQKSKDFLEKHHYFGNPNVSLFTQDLMPLLDDKQDWLKDKNGGPVLAPNGNGEVLKHFYDAGLFADWKKLGIQRVNIVPIDNPLADPNDPELFSDSEDIVVKCIKRRSQYESTGVMGLKDKHLSVAEYSEAADMLNIKEFPLAYIGLVSFSMHFIESIKNIKLKLHVAQKKGFWKFETFLFDVFQKANSYRVVVGEREKCFAPIKRKEDLVFARKALELFESKRGKI